MREGERRLEFADKTSIEIARIYAIQSAIGKGVGKALIEKCIAVADEMKKEVIWLSVWEKNERPVAFYTKFGFEKFVEQEFVMAAVEPVQW